MKENPAIVLGQSEDIAKQKAMKDRLCEYRSLNKEIDNEIERLERMEDRLYSLGSPTLGDMPKSKSSVYDKMADRVARKVDLEATIKELISYRDSERVAIEGMVRRLRNADERAVIRMRYLDLEEWEDILYMLFGGKEDYDDKYDNYKQRMFRLHSAAIEGLAEL